MNQIEGVGAGLPVANGIDKIDLSVVIPVYNSEKSLGLLAGRLETVLNGLERPWEVIFVNDSSPDDSWRIIEKIVHERQGFRGLMLARNVGQARATLCGIGVAIGDIVITMDDDLQHEPEALPMLISELDSGADCDGLFAWFPHKQHSGWRNLASRLIRYLNAQAFGLGSVKVSSYRLMRRHVADFVSANNSSIATPGALMLAASRHIKSVPIEHRPRAYGDSNYTLIRQLRLALTNLVAVSLLPLRLIAGLGIATAVLSALMVIFTLVRYFTTGFGVPGWATLVILVTFFSGMILLSVGVIGEYLVRVLRELQYNNAVPVRRAIGF